MADDVATLTARLEAIRAVAVEISMGRDITTDAEALSNESNAVAKAISDHAAAMLPVITEMARSLKAELEGAPDEVKKMHLAYEDAAAAARFDWIEPPRFIFAFMFLDSLERLRGFCAHEAKKRRR